MTHKTITIQITIPKTIKFWKRVSLGCKLLFEPLRTREELREEYRDWKRVGIISTPFQKIAYIFDHFIFWPVYVMIAVFTGHTQGFSWEVKKREGDKNVI